MSINIFRTEQATKMIFVGLPLLVIILVFLVIKIQWRRLDKQIDSYYSVNILKNARPNFRVTETKYEGISIVRHWMYSRVFFDRVSICSQIKEIIDTDENYKYKFKHLNEFFTNVNDIIEEYGCTDKVSYTYNKNTNKVTVKFLLSQLESEI